MQIRAARATAITSPRPCCRKNRTRRDRSAVFPQPSSRRSAHRLAHLLHADTVAVVIVAVLADRDVEIELGITFVGLRLAQITGGAGAAHHDTGKPPTPGICELDHGDTDVALLEDAIFRSNPSMSSQTLRK